MAKVHWVNHISGADGTSWALCGRWVPNEQAYRDGDKAITCRSCARIMESYDK